MGLICSRCSGFNNFIKNFLWPDSYKSKLDLNNNIEYTVLGNENSIKIFGTENPEQFWICSMRKKHPISQNWCSCLDKWCSQNPITVPK